MNITFSPCFPEQTVIRIAPYVPSLYAELRKAAPWVRCWPAHIECMSNAEILDGRRRGAGHGQYSHAEQRVWVNPYMTAWGVILNLCHELCHHCWPDATEHEINNLLVPHIMERVVKCRIDLDEARMHGLGPIVDGIRGRGFASNYNRARMLRGARL